MSISKDGNKAYQPIPAYTEASYGELFRCYADEIRLLKRLRAARRGGCVFVLVNIDALELCLVGGAEQYGRLVDKMAKFE